MMKPIILASFNGYRPLNKDYYKKLNNLIRLQSELYLKCLKPLVLPLVLYRIYSSDRKCTDLTKKNQDFF